tara:strand:- start:90139 stop:91233 length:1095 start_codon:yes stop_codon:yes gene_type:complete
MKLFKDNRVGVKAAYIIGLATIIAALLTVVISNIFKLNQEVSKVTIQEKVVFTNEDLINSFDSISEKTLPNGIHYIEKGSDIDLVQFLVNQNLSDFELYKDSDKSFNHIGFNKNYDYDRLDSMFLDIPQTLFKDLHTRTSSILNISAKEDISYEIQNSYDEIFDSLLRAENLDYEKLKRFAPIFDISLYNKSKKDLIVSNMEIDIVRTAPVGWGGGGPTDVNHADSISSLKLYNLKIPKNKLFFYQYSEEISSDKTFFDSITPKYLKEQKELKDSLENILGEYSSRGLILSQEILNAKFNESTLNEKPINYELLPPIKFPSEAPLRLQIRIFHEGPEMEEFWMILRLKFYNSNSIVEIPLQFLM